MIIGYDGYQYGEVVSVIIIVEDVDEVLVFIVISFSVVEDVVVGLVVVEFQVVDFEGQDVIYSFVEILMVFELNSDIGEILLLDGVILDYEIVILYSFEIIVLDGEKI